jgi:hypothetical protein
VRVPKPTPTHDRAAIVWNGPSGAECATGLACLAGIVVGVALVAIPGPTRLVGALLLITGVGLIGSSRWVRVHQKEPLLLLNAGGVSWHPTQLAGNEYDVPWSAVRAIVLGRDRPTLWSLPVPIIVVCTRGPDSTAEPAELSAMLRDGLPGLATLELPAGWDTTLTTGSLFGRSRDREIREVAAAYAPDVEIVGRTGRR